MSEHYKSRTAGHRADHANEGGSRELLDVKGLTKWFPVREGIRKKPLKAVDGISFKLHRGETLGIVGESGSGKSTLGRCVSRLVQPSAGEVWFESRNLMALRARELRKFRKNMQMVFQDPYASLNPRQRIGETIGEPLAIHGLAAGKAERGERVREILRQVGLKPEFADRYPHEMSGGQRQRVGIARALAASPKLIVFDEAVSALDVSVQAQILNVIQDLQEQLGLSYLFISHDLSVVRHVADRIGVMYLGEFVEMGPAEEIFTRPRHPYTRALLTAAPVPGGRGRRERVVLKGEIPSPIDPPDG
ncbi:ATP-binding cassette domain-containing protein, partial [Paenibacillus macerans]|uniref:ABC transporter ATP-binding protein n=1 Tax=Paenibacillus macerans TaxID=44252 RepID=UPI002E1FD255